jgi:hypothetical protein
MALPAPSRSADRSAHAQRPGASPQSRRHLDVFHQRNLRKASELVEENTRDEDRLIAGRNAGEARAPVHHRGDHPQQRACAGDADIEPSPLLPAFRHACEQKDIGVVGQAGVRVQEEQNVTFCARRARVHLACASAGRRQDRVRSATSERKRVIAAAAVYHDDLDSAASRVGERC